MKSVNKVPNDNLIVGIDCVYQVGEGMDQIISQKNKHSFMILIINTKYVVIAYSFIIYYNTSANIV